MAKALSNTPPSSSVARLFDQGAVARALSPATSSGQKPGPTVPQPVSHDSRPPESVVIKREFVFTPAAEEALTRLVQVYRNATGTRLSNSHLIRAVLRGVAHGLPAIEREANRMGPLKLPSNAKGREVERERFEKALASSFIAAMRTLPAYGQDCCTNVEPLTLKYS